MFVSLYTEVFTFTPGKSDSNPDTLHEVMIPLVLVVYIQSDSVCYWL